MQLKKPVFTCIFTGALSATLWLGCTGDEKGLSRQLVLQKPTALAAECKPENLAPFESLHLSKPLDFSQQPLPQGVFLYSGAEWRVTKGSGKAQQSLIANESLDGKNFASHVVCATRSQVETSGDVESSLSGVTKIQSDGAGGTQVHIRQFQAFMTKQDQGVLALTPRLTAKPIKTLDDFMNAAGPGAKFFRVDDHSYILSVRRNSPDQQAELVIRYDFFPQSR